jgi:hypothetical protein
MASEPVLSREVGNRTSRVSQPVIVTSAMFRRAQGDVYTGEKWLIAAQRERREMRKDEYQEKWEDQSILSTGDIYVYIYIYILYISR